MYNESCNCEKQSHVHELTGSTKVFSECDECHNHRFCTVTGEAKYTPDKTDHYHEVKDRTGKADGHKHEFQAATLIDSPTDHKRYR